MSGRRAADRAAEDASGRRARDDCTTCSNISVMQLFHELKQQYPALPDRLVSECATANCHDRARCSRLLGRAARDMTQAAYPARALRRAPDPPPIQPPQQAPPAPPPRPTTLHFARPSRQAPPPPLPLPPNMQETIEEQYPVNLSLDLNCSGGHSRNPLRASVTSVNVTVRTPVGSPLQPPSHQPAAHHQQGFQSSLHITVSPSSATPSRLFPQQPPAPGSMPPRRPRSYYGPLVPEPPTTTCAGRVARAESLPNVLADLAPHQASTVQRQLERKHRLECELEAERSRLRAMQREVRALEGPAVSQGPGRALMLKQEIKALQGKCVVLAQRVDQYTGEPVPLGETSEEFYQNIYTGQQFHMPERRGRRRDAPARPPHLDGVGQHWTCHLCTFRNHPLLDKCEQCEMPRILRVPAGEDIHIHVTPGRDSVIHSWVV